MTKNFQIIGIRPLKGCHEDFRKILKTNRLYLFDDRYDIHYDDNDEVDRIAFVAKKDVIPRNFYSDVLNIHIHAVVGGNGSGKSAIAELFLYLLFFYGIRKGLISKHQFPSDSDDENELFSQIRFTTEMNLMKVNLNVELLFVYEGSLYHIILRKNEFSIKNYEKQLTSYVFQKNIPFESFVLPFYTMYVNYSHYGLNTNVDGIWLGTLFHKNDGYQLPVVINPYRKKGNIDINVENYLSRNRVFTNVVDTADSTLIFPDLEINHIEIARDSSKSDSKINLADKKSREIDYLIKPLYRTFFPDEEYPLNLNNFQKEVEGYLIEKIRTITERYVDYKDYNQSVLRVSSGFIPSNIEPLCQIIHEDRSHVTLKIRQSLNFLRRDLYKIDVESNSKEFTLEQVVELINKVKEDQFFTETIDYLPPPIFMTRFHFKDKSHFDQLSSGEKQQVYSNHSIIYHLKNIDSVFEGVGDKLKYNSVLLILDEIELYYHPQAQKRTIDRLLYILHKSNLKYVKNLNIMFLTHSPFILSDIPSEFTLKLREGEIFNQVEKEKTFAANITDLLTDSFFLEKGLMGEFAKRKIDEVVSWLNFKILDNEIKSLKSLEKDNKELQNSLVSKLAEHSEMKKAVKKISNKDCLQLISIVDEPLLKYKMEEMYFQAYPNEANREDAIEKARQILGSAGLTFNDLNNEDQ